MLAVGTWADASPCINLLSNSAVSHYSISDSSVLDSFPDTNRVHTRIQATGSCNTSRCGPL